MIGDDPVGERESQACSLYLGGEESVEDGKLLGEPRAVILDVDLHRVSDASGAQREVTAALVHGLDRVPGQVQKDLTKASGLA